MSRCQLLWLSLLESGIDHAGPKQLLAIGVDGIPRIPVLAALMCLSLMLPWQLSSEPGIDGWSLPLWPGRNQPASILDFSFLSF